MSGTYNHPVEAPVKPREEGLARTFECRHGGVVCSAKITGETDEEVLAKAVEHAKEKHGVDLSQSKTLAGYAQSLIRDEGDSDPR